MAKKKGAVAKVDSKRGETWAGAQSLMSKPLTDKQKHERDTIMLVSWALGVSPFGVNILGSLPYINKLGLMQKAEEYADGRGVMFEYQWVQRALNDADKAIVECRVLALSPEAASTTDTYPITGWVTGECSPKTMSMSTLQGYQNHMAQTRARNRAILEAYGVRIHEEMMRRIAEKSGLDKDSQMLVLGATVSSAEEMDYHQPKEQKTVSDSLPEITQAEFEGIKAEVAGLKGSKDRKEVDAVLKGMKVKKMTGEYTTEQYAYLSALVKNVLVKHSGI